MNQSFRSTYRKLDGILIFITKGPIVKLKMRKILDISKIRKEEE